MRLRLVATACFSIALLSPARSAFADGVLPSAATPVQREQAQSRFLRGKELIGKKRFDEALAELRASREIVASPNARLEIARCLVAMGRVVEGYAELGRTAVEAKELTREDNRYQRTFDAARAERAELEPTLGFVSLTIDHPADATRVTVAGEEIRRAAWSEPVPVQPGTAEIVVETPGRLPLKRTVTLAAGEKNAVEVDVEAAALEAPPAPAPAPATAPPPAAPVSGVSWARPGAFVAGGIAVAGLATFTVFGLMARSTYDDLNGACGGGRCPPSKSDEIASGRTQQTIANVGLAFGVAGAAAATAMFLLSSSSRPPPSPGAALVVAPAWIGIRGSL